MNMQYSYLNVWILLFYMKWNQLRPYRNPQGVLKNYENIHGHISTTGAKMVT
mgnify:CR=1 FL=1